MDRCTNLQFKYKFGNTGRLIIGGKDWLKTDGDNNIGPKVVVTATLDANLKNLSKSQIQLVC